MLHVQFLTSFLFNRFKRRYLIFKSINGLIKLVKPLYSGLLWVYTQACLQFEGSVGVIDFYCAFIFLMAFFYEQGEEVDYDKYEKETYLFQNII